ncbi:MAG: ATP-binding protein [Geminicoccaceae bacterium]
MIDRRQEFATCPQLCGLVAIGVGLLVTVGWLLDIQLLKQPLSSSVPMNPTTAASLVALGVALALPRGLARRGLRIMMQRTLAGGVAMIGAIKLIDLLMGWDSGIDRQLFAGALATDSMISNNAMAPNTAVDLVLNGCALFLILGRYRWRIPVSQGLALVSMVVSSMALLGYAYGSLTLYQIPNYVPMALLTAVAFLVVAIGVLSIRPHRGVVGLVTSPDAAGAVVRRLLPVMMGVPIVLGFLWLWAIRAELLDFAPGVAMFVVLIITPLTAAVLVVARQLQAALRELAARNHALLVARKAADVANEAKSEFLANMSHELRTPLTAVLGVADLLSTEPLNDRQVGHVRLIRNSGQQLLAVINNVLDFSKLAHGRIETENVPVDLDGMLEDVISVMAPRATEGRLALRVNKAADLPGAMLGDTTRIKQILFNLVGNALKFTEHGSVTVDVETTTMPDGQRTIRFTVTDTGIGMSEAQLGQLFQSFVQADSSTTRRYGGTGLGLAISKQLAEAMRGSMGVSSRLDHGSRFWFELPLAAAEKPPEPSPSAESLALSRPLKILLAEDVEVNQQLVVELLGRHGHQVTAVADGAAAVATARRGGFDVVLMDIHMPVMNGFDATRQIRALPAPAGRVPIIALTASVMPDTRRRFLEAGMDDSAVKPIIWNDLLAAIARHTPEQPTPEITAEPTPTESAAPPLVDLPSLEMLARMMSRQKLDPLLGRVVSQAEAAAERLAAPGIEADEIVHLMHKVRGALGSFGCVAISRAAGDIEDRATLGLPLGEMVAEFARLIRDTRRELDAVYWAEPAATV